MPGRSIIIFLLNDNLDKVISYEKIYLGKDMKLRHFVTNKKNEIYEDNQGSIYVSADLKGIYKISFSEFRWNYLWFKSITLRWSGPLYLERGLISLFAECCSMMCAAQPVIRDITNIGVKKSVSNPIKW